MLGRILRVDHCEAYKQPRDHDDTDDVTKRLRDEGCAPKLQESSDEGSDDEPELLPKVKVKKGQSFHLSNVFMQCVHVHVSRVFDISYNILLPTKSSYFFYNSVSMK